MATQISFKQCISVASQQSVQLRKKSVASLTFPVQRVFAPLPSRKSFVLRASANEPESPETTPKSTPPPANPGTPQTPAGEETGGGSFMGKFFGTYLQLGVWICVLTYAAYTGYQKSATDPDAVGLLIAPPSAAAFLIGSFLVWRFVLNKDEFSD